MRIGKILWNYYEFACLHTTMLVIFSFLYLLCVSSIHCSEQADHRDFQYNSLIDPVTGRYNFAYDTGHDNEIAHSLHMQYQDANGIVRGRYGYTDPRGKLRMVEYEAGPNGFVARGDVGPDQFPHGQAPAAPVSMDTPLTARYTDQTTARDFNLDPAPVQMSGWDPEADPMDGGQRNEITSSVATGFEYERPSFREYDDSNQLTSVNITSNNALELYGPELGFNTETSSDSNPDSGRSLESEDFQSENFQSDDRNRNSAQTVDSQGLTIDNIDVDPDSIRVAVDENGRPVRRSVDTVVAGSSASNIGTSTSTSGISERLTAVAQSSQEQEGSSSVVRRSADQSPIVRVTATYDPHDHDAEIKYRTKHTHDHDAERKYYSRYTHDHDAERKYYTRHVHDHNAERRYPVRYYHNHDAEKHHNHARYYPGRRVYYRDSHSQVPHEHPYEYYRRHYHSTYPRRSILYKDSHSSVPHEHYTDHEHHEHSDSHLYGRYRNYEIPPTEKSSHIKYIPSDKYHDKAYYWKSD